MNGNVKKFLSTLVALALVLALFSACGANTANNANNNAANPNSSSDETPQEGEAVKVGLLVERLGDNSLSDMMYNAVQKAQETYGFQLDVSECGSGDMSLTLQDYVDDGSYDLIILMYHALDAANAAYETNPDQKFLVYDVEAEGNPSMISEAFAKNQLGFIAGVFTALMEEKGTVTLNGTTTTWTPSNQFGSILGVELTSTIGAITGFEAGVKYINPDAEVQTAVIGDWADQAAARELALAIYNSGVHILFHNAGGAFLGALEAARSTNQFAIGYDANQNSLAPDNTLASAYKNHAGVLDRFFADFMAGEWDGGICILNGYDNDGALFAYQDGLEVPEDVAQIVEDTIERIKSGEIDPPNSQEELDAWTMTYEG